MSKSVLPPWFHERMRELSGIVSPSRVVLGPWTPPPPPQPKPPSIPPVDIESDLGPVPVITGRDIRQRIADTAGTQVANRCPYRWARVGPCSEGFDCAGLVHFAVKRVTGIELPRSGEGQLGSSHLRRVGRDGVLRLSDLQPGDVLFWDTGVVHSGIYAGDGRMHNALNESQGLATSIIQPSSYWGSDRARYIGARRLV